MVRKIKDSHSKDSSGTHQYYLDIINCMPGIVYWIDINCNLMGCNNNFVKWLSLKRSRDFSGTPYQQIAASLKWSAERIEAFRLDDMAVLFSREPQYDIEEASAHIKKKDVIYKVTRVPLFDKDKHIIGLVVVLNESMKPAVAEDTSKRKTSAVDLKKIHQVLMVEDNFIAQKVEGALLTALNCQVDIAESGDKAILLFHPGKYDLVFMDIGLQDTSGYVVAKKIRQMEENINHPVPIIALTSYQADVIQVDCHDYEMDGVITKPLTSEQAKQIIQRYIYHENIPVSGLKSPK